MDVAASSGPVNFKAAAGAETRVEQNVSLSDSSVDTGNHRVLGWTPRPKRGSFVPADSVIGQRDFAGDGENRWTAVERDTLCWPFGIALHDAKLAVADSGNNRVMLYRLSR